MSFSSRVFDLHLRHPFQIARREAMRVRPIVLLEANGGVGEASPSSYYGDTVETVLAALEAFRPVIEENPPIEVAVRRMNELLPRHPSAKAAVDVALHDALGKRAGLPLYALLGLDKNGTPLTSFTIGIDRLEVIAEKIAEAAAYPVLKIKLGTPRDEEILKTVRAATDKVIRVDANAGWTREEALRWVKRLADCNVEFVEQPLPPDDLEGLRLVKEASPLPIFADESCVTSADIPRLVGCVDGINIKLMKCGGLREAWKMIHAARTFDLKVMLGCMVESSVAITAAAHLSPTVDYADLDGNLLITNDPYEGATVEAGKLVLPDRPGLGVVKREKR
ncbi:MAG: dipeptide epimerase [Abditibacteriales bacterium]|nr:dipeptide epimerase [Abditibacteriales bacterium]MDW8367499.1 dipeptide epimerase [Abditibacteriales bacterium]